MFSQLLIPEEEVARLASDCSHVCPNCEGPITVGEHEAAGICSDCYFGAIHDQDHDL